MFCFFYVDHGFELKFFFLSPLPPALSYLGKKKKILAFVKASLIYFNKFFLIIMKYNGVP